MICLTIYCMVFKKRLRSLVVERLTCNQQVESSSLSGGSFIPLFNSCLFITAFPRTEDKMNLFLTDFHIGFPDAGVESFGFECNQLDRNGSGSVSGGVDIGVDGPFLRQTIATERDRVKVKIKLKEETLHKRTYSESFLESEEVDRFEYEGRDGLVYIWRYWGSDGCDFDIDDPR